MASLSLASTGANMLPASTQGTLDMTVVRPGRYVMTDRLGRQVGEIQGDYVIGFRALHQGQRANSPASSRLALTSSSSGSASSPRWAS